MSSFHGSESVSENVRNLIVKLKTPEILKNTGYKNFRLRRTKFNKEFLKYYSCFKKIIGSNSGNIILFSFVEIPNSNDQLEWFVTKIVEKKIEHKYKNTQKNEKKRVTG